MSESSPSFREMLGLPEQTSHQVFEVSPEGRLIFRGYSVQEVKALLEAHRSHLVKLTSLAQEAQGGLDAFHYRPVGSEDV